MPRTSPCPWMCSPGDHYNDLEHARTGTSAVGRTRARASAGGDRRRRATASPKFGVVDVVAQHDEEADEELARDRDPGLRAPATVAEREVGAFEIDVETSGVGGRLAKELPCLVIWPSRSEPSREDCNAPARIR